MNAPQQDGGPAGNEAQEYMAMMREANSPETKHRNLRDWFAGMVRDWFAGMVIGECFAAPCPPAWTRGSHEHREQSVAAAYAIADAMLAARKEKP